MKLSRITILLLSILILSMQTYAADIYNQNGDFSVEVSDSLKKTVYNDDIISTLSFIVESDTAGEKIQIIVPRQSGWTIETSDEEFTLGRGESQEVTITFDANSDFDYTPNVVSPDIIKISKKEDYVGSFEFPILVQGEKEDVSLKLALDINKRAANTNFEVRFSNEGISPNSPFGYTIQGEDLELEEQDVEIVVELGDNILTSTTTKFSSKNSYKIFQSEIPSSIEPGQYNLRTTIRLLGNDAKSAKEWYDSSLVTVVPYENLKVNKIEKNTFFGKLITLEIENTGNIKTNFEETFSISFIDRFFLNAYDGNSNNIDYTRDGAEVSVSIPIEKAQMLTLNYSLNYLPLFILFVIIVVIIVYMYIRMSSNPLDVETRVYEIKKVEHEGIKSLKIRIGFENIKEDQLDSLRLIFRMPSYLNVKEDTFLLSPPNHVLKGKSQYKLEWDFKKFEKNDSRIIGFTLINARGILGDIKMPDLELEVKSSGKTRKYFEAFPIIKG